MSRAAAARVGGFHAALARVFLLLLFACARESGSSRPVAEVDTLSNGGIRVRGPAQGVWRPEERWQLVEELRLGRSDGGGPDVFGEVWDVTQDGAGRIYVIDRQAKDVRVFTATGQHVRTLGRPGEGPGEFVEPFSFAWDPAGRLWVVDVRLARYTVFDTAGSIRHTYGRRVGGFSWPWPGRFDRQGTLYEPSFFAGGVRPLIAFRVDSLELVAVDTFPRALDMPAGSDFWDLRDNRGIGTIARIPFGRTTEWVLDDSARVWLGASGEYRLVQRTLAGDTLRVIEREVAAPPVAEAERNEAIAGLTDAVRRHPKLDLSRIPASKPFFDRLIPDAAGRLWVLREGAGDAWGFDVFDERGWFLGVVDLPFKPELFPPPRIGEQAMLVVTRDSLDVPSIVRLRIERGSGPH
jgi:hypothetical protein